MRIKTARAGLPAVLALMALAAVGCSEEGAAQPAPGAPAGGASSAPATESTEASTGSPDGAVPLDSLAACDTADSAELAAINVAEEGREDGAQFGASSVCVWQSRSAADRAVSVSVAIRPEQGIDEVQAGEGQLTDGKVGDRPAKQLAGDTGGACTLALRVGPKSRVDVVAVGGVEVTEACDIAGKAATVVEPKLPTEEE